MCSKCSLPLSKPNQIKRFNLLKARDKELHLFFKVVRDQNFEKLPFFFLSIKILKNLNKLNNSNIVILLCLNQWRKENVVYQQFCPARKENFNSIYLRIDF